MIYFVRDADAGCVKIGFSRKPALRFNKIKADCANAVKLVAVVEGEEADENELHSRFAHLRRRGEWFYERAELAALIASLPPYAKPPGKRVGRGRNYSPTALADWLVINRRTDASLAEEIGVSRACVSHIRRGIRRPSVQLAVRLCRATGLSLNNLVEQAA